MKNLSSTEIRNLWMEYFASKGHNVMESAPLVPYDDDSLLFINAGVTPLKKYFDGSVVPENKRIATIQKCIRTNDIENVGVTKRHLTFFEMMGNFSIGDYFKQEALEFAYEFLTDEKWAGIPKEKIYVTVYSNDEETYNKWLELGLTEEQIVRLDGNFWEIGEGPCGPDSEIFYDRGEEYDPDGDALEKFKRDEDQERFLEIWNNVFSQFNSEIGKDRDEYRELPHKNIDTGAGLERWCCIFQGVDSPFDTDLFKPIIEQIEAISDKKYEGDKPFKVIADHIRAITMALSDGVVFENTGRGYVLRRLLRRSVREGKKLGINEPFIYKLVDNVVNISKDNYPNLLDTQANVKALVYNEEELFHNTLEAGERRLKELMKEASDIDKTISGYDVFKLYDTYGFPFELTMEYLEEEGYTTNEEEFNKYMEEAKMLSKSSRKNDASMNSQNEALLNFKDESTFSYDVEEMTSKVIALIKDGEFVDSLSDNGYVILDKTCFYAESGGQVADHGGMKSDNFKLKVRDVTKAPNGQHLHKVEVIEGTVKKGDSCKIKIISEERARIKRNHSATHILQKTLQEILSKNIHQAGSYVDDKRLRFDFTYTNNISDDEILQIEQRANERINENNDVIINEMPIEEAKKKGAMALFTDKYKDIVRVVEMGDSIELCGGTHVSNTQDIKHLAILKLESKGSNVYRIEAATGDNIESAISSMVEHYIEEIKKQLDKAKKIIKSAQDLGKELDFEIDLNQVPMNSYGAILYNKSQLEYIQTEVRNLEKRYNSLKIEKMTDNLDKYLDAVEEINGVKAIVMKLENEDINALKEIMDRLVERLGKSVVFFANVKGNNVNFLCRSACDLHAGIVVKNASQMALGNGGGSPKFAQGGGHSIDLMDKIFKEVKQEIK